MMHIEPVTLSGKVARLEPLGKQHIADLQKAGQDESIWTYISIDPPLTLELTEQWITDALWMQEKGLVIPFAIVDQSSGQAVGSTRYLNIARADHGLEIGWTWLSAEARRTAVNTECKYLLLRHAFETLGAIRVCLKTDSRNLRSQRAIERIGGVKEGVLRNHMIMPDGHYRHSVYYSIIESEWPQVKAGLEERMQPR